MFLLDTDHLTIVQRQTQPEYGRLWPRIAAHPPDAFYASIVSFHEQALGWNTYISRATNAAGVVRGYRMFQRILSDFAAARVLPFDDAAATTFDALRAGRVRVPTMDLRIASIALSRDLTLLTRNTADFSKVPGLRSEDWTA